MATDYTPDDQIQEEILRRRGVASGRGLDDIEFEIEKMRADSSLGKKVAYTIAKAAPVALGVAGSLGGFALGTIPGAALGGFAGYGAGKATEDMILEAFGIRKPTPEQRLTRVKEVTKGAVTAGVVDAATMGALKALGFVLKPLKTLGVAREAAVGARTVPTSVLEEEVLKGAEQSTRMNPELQQLAREKASTFLTQTAPMETVGTGAKMSIAQPTELGINDVYRNLSEFEKANRAYNSVAGNAEASRAVSGAARQYLTSQIPTSAKMLNTAYGATAKVLPLVKRNLPRAIMYYLAYRALSGAGKKLGLGQ